MDPSDGQELGPSVAVGAVLASGANIESGTQLGDLLAERSNLFAERDLGDQPNHPQQEGTDNQHAEQRGHGRKQEKCLERTNSGRCQRDGIMS